MKKILTILLLFLFLCSITYGRCYFYPYYKSYYNRSIYRPHTLFSYNNSLFYSYPFKTYNIRYDIIRKQKGKKYYHRQIYLKPKNKRIIDYTGCEQIKYIPIKYKKNKYRRTRRTRKTRRIKGIKRMRTRRRMRKRNTFNTSKSYYYYLRTSRKYNR